ncbi:MAG: sigma 54-dependent Fis family transcriptional regulator [Thermoanaerobaculia bacterium]|nr:sigma 54-dependent Fis family transcriptional regulator [Thermoanaerobaculia bacterium]
MKNPSEEQYVLCGEIDGTTRTYWLGRGINRIGSRPGRGIVLAARGVSKRHALLIIEPDRVSVEDLGSKNGTFVGERRIDSSVLQAGDILRFGPVRLELRILPTDEGLAIHLDPRIGTCSDSAGHDSGRLPSASNETPHLRAEEENSQAGCPTLQAFVGALPSRRDGSLATSCSELATMLGAEGVALVELGPGSEASIVSCSGSPPERLMKLLASLEAGDERDHLHTLCETGESLQVAWRPSLGPAAARGLAVAVWGGPSSTLSKSFWSVVLDLAARFGPQTPSTEPRQRAEVHLPDGYVRCGSAPMVRLYRQLAAVAPSDLPVLVVGATGVGKEGIARVVHLSSNRCRGPFVAVNCAAIPADLLESELFGICKGVATGVAEREGQFTAAEGGTLFLDEIGDMSADLQAKLLRALQEQEVTPLGGSARKIDVRVVSATNIQLQDRLDDGSFRRDLYYRLAGCTLHIPALAERRRDIPALVETFLRQASAASNSAVRGLSLGALELLIRYPWPGNVRQLENTVHRLVCLAEDAQIIDVGLVDDALEHDHEYARGSVLPTLHLGELERRAVVQAMDQCDANQTQAAELLGITRTALYRRLARYGLSPVDRKPGLKSAAEDVA